MGSSHPTPMLSSRASPEVDDGTLPLDDTYSSEEDEKAAELNDTSSSSGLAYPGDASDAPTGAPRVLKRVKGKEKDVAMVSKKKRSLQLLDLPVDILKEIIKEVNVTDELSGAGWLIRLCRSRIQTT